MKLFANRAEDPERAPLLPQHNGHTTGPQQNGHATGSTTTHADAVPPVLTSHQRSLDGKLHTYLMLRALARGYLPSTDQLVAILRKLLSSPMLLRDNRHLTTDGKKLVNMMRKLTSQIIDLLQTKNGRDELQDLLSELRRARVQVDVEGLGDAVSTVNSAPTKARAAFGSLSEIGSLMMQNPEFNSLISDATTVLREVVGASASTAADYADKAASQIDPSGEAPDDEDLLGELGETAAEGAKKTKDQAAEAFDETMTPEKEKQLKGRVRDAVRSLRKNADYQTSVSTVTILVKQYLLAYSTAVQNAVDEVNADVQPNRALNKAGALLWSFITSFGDKAEWDKLRHKVEDLKKYQERDPDFEKTVSAVIDALYRLMTDPDYLFGEDGDKDLPKVDVNGPDEFKQDLDQVVRQLGSTWKSVWNDKQILDIASTSRSIIALLFEGGFNRDLLADVFHVLVPLALEFVQFIPIPRITLTSPEIDLLLEPLILEPGRTVNSTSFLPYSVSITTTNEINLFKGPKRVSSSTSSTAHVEIRGITVKAEGVGYVLHYKKFPWFTDSGIASFHLDEKGLDIGLDLEFTRSLADHMVVLKGVNVKLHKLDFTLKRSKFSFLAWIMKPFVRPLLRKLLENSLRDAIEAGLRTANRELVYSRERLRATRIADPKDLTTFIRAVLARWRSPLQDQVDLNVGWQSRDEDIFHGVYAPGTLVGLMEGTDPGETVEEQAQGRWRNECFDFVGENGTFSYSYR